MGRVRKKYPREFELEAVRLMQSVEHSMTELALRLNVKEHELRTWRRDVENKKAEAFPGAGRAVGQSAEMARLKRELEQVKEERDIKKKRWPSSRGSHGEVPLHP